MSEDIARRYRALAGTAPAGSKGRTELHLIREDAETSLCGIPRAQLSVSTGEDAFVCSECLDWLPKRVAFSGVYPKVKLP